MGCVYTLKLNNKSVLDLVSEKDLRQYIRDNASEFDRYSTLSVRYQMSFDEATSTLKSYNDALYKQLQHDRKLARQRAAIRAMHPEIEASEDWGKDTTSILQYAEQVANQYIDGFDLANWKKHKTIFYEEHKEELANILPLDKDLDLINMPKDQLDILINQALEKEIKSWDYRASLGKGLHYVMSAIMNSKNQRADLTSLRYKDDLIDKMLEYLEDDDERNNYIGNNKDIIMKFIDDIVDFKFKTILFGKGNQKPTILTDFIIDGTTSMGEHIRGKIDLLVLYPDGSIDIYDLKTSTTNYQYWDANKKKVYQYLLGYYKRLLSTLGFSSNKINMHIIPAKLDYDKLNDTHMSNVSVQEVLSIANSSDENARINSDIKLNMSVAENSVINNVEKRLTALFSKINFIQGIQGRTRDSIKLNFMSRTSDGKFRLNNIFSENNKIELYDTEAEVEAAIDKMLELSKDAVVTNVAHITNLLSAELKRRNSNKNKTFYETYQYGYLNPVLPANFVGNYIESMVNMQLQPYRLEAGWEVVTSDDFTNMGIIVLVNQYTKQIDIISVVNNDPKIKVDLDNGGDTLLGLKSSEISSNEMISNIGNIETIKLLCVIEELLLLPEYSEYKVNALKQLSMVKNTGTYLELDVERAINTYKKLCNRKSLASKSDMQAVDRVERAYIAYANAMKISSDNASWKNVEKVDNSIVSNNRADKSRAIKALQDIRDSLKNTFFKESNPDTLNYSPEAYLFNLISTELAYLQGTSIDLLNSNPIDKYGFRKALKNRSFLNGTDLNSIDTIPIIRGIYDVYFKANKEIRRLYTEQYKSLDTKETKKFYDDAFSITSNKVVNAYALSFKDLLDTSEDGKKRFLMKNPYDPSTTLNDAQRAYAKYWLAQVNAYRYNLNPEMLLKRDKPIEKIIEDWENRFSEDISELRYNGKYFEIPLANASVSSMVLNKHFNIKRLWNKGKEDITNPTENILNNEESDEIEMEVDLELNEMYDHFNSTDSNEDYRKAVLAKGDPTQFFETNLEQVKDMYIFSKIRKLKYDKIIPSINNALVQLAYVRKITGKPSKDLEQFIIDFMKSSVFNKHLIDKNMTPFIALVNLLKKVSSLAILGFNYISGIKETFVGYLTLVNRALSNMSNAENRKYRYSVADMLKAYNFVWVDALKQINNITLLEHLNRVTGISNVDVNSLVEESNYSRSSLGRFSNRLFWNNRAPDFLNRMTIIVSYMMKFGIMDAYKINKDTGMIEYNWRKDKRFERYAKNDLSNKELYNDLKALYNRMKREFVEEGYKIINPDGTTRLMTMDDDLPEAFTTTENKKFKSESDMIFGYMDHDVKSLFFRRSAGILFGQFMTYITAKKNQWFLARGQYGDGHWEHMTNNEGLKLYFKYYEKNGQLMSEITTEVTDDPVWDWKGDVYEGIFWSLLDLSKALISFDGLNISEVLADPIKRRNCIYALNDMFFALILFLVAKMLLDGEDDTAATKTTAKIMKNTRRDINPIEIFGGVMDVSITSLDFAKDLVSSTWELVTGDTNIMKYLGSNVSAFRPIRDAVLYNLD